MNLINECYAIARSRLDSATYERSGFWDIVLAADSVAEAAQLVYGISDSEVEALSNYIIARYSDEY